MKNFYSIAIATMYLNLQTKLLGFNFFFVRKTTSMFPFCLTMLNNDIYVNVFWLCKSYFRQSSIFLIFYLIQNSNFLMKKWKFVYQYDIIGHLITDSPIMLQTLVRGFLILTFTAINLEMTWRVTYLKRKQFQTQSHRRMLFAIGKTEL